MKQIGGDTRMPNGAIMPFSAGMEVGEFVFFSGQLALRNGALPEGGITEQANATIDNIEDVLKLAGLGLGDVVKSTVWLTSKADFAAFNAVYASRFAAPYPVRSTVVCELVLPGALVEIEVMARRRR